MKKHPSLNIPITENNRLTIPWAGYFDGLDKLESSGGSAPTTTIVHNDTTSRDASEAHPITSITGLSSILDVISGDIVEVDSLAEIGATHSEIDGNPHNTTIDSIPELESKLISIDNKIDLVDESKTSKIIERILPTSAYPNVDAYIPIGAITRVDECFLRLAVFVKFGGTGDSQALIFVDINFGTSQKYIRATAQYQSSINFISDPVNTTWGSYIKYYLTTDGTIGIQLDANALSYPLDFSVAVVSAYNCTFAYSDTEWMLGSASYWQKNACYMGYVGQDKFNAPTLQEYGVSLEDKYTLISDTEDLEELINTKLNTSVVATLSKWRGFVNPSGVVRTYDYTTRKVTLSGDTRYCWDGELKNLGTWTSSAHDAINGKWFLSSSDGVNSTWSISSFTFDIMHLAIAYYGASDKFGISENHGCMDWQGREIDHDVVGTYRKGTGGGLTAGTYAVQPSSPTDADNTPGFDSVELRDEDLPTTLPAWTQGSYTQCYGNTSNTTIFTKAQSSIVPIGTTHPKYNSAGTLTELATNNYMWVYRVAVPTMSDTESLKYSWLMVPGSYVYTNTTTALAEPVTLNLGDISAMSAEYNVVGRILIQTSASYSSTGKFRIHTEQFVYGTRSAPIAVGGVGVSDHGALSGLSDDDHTQYILADGTRAFSASPAFSSLTANTVPYLDANKKLASSSVTPTELGYVSGVTSNIQTQFGAKMSTASYPDLVAIEALSGTSGLLKKTAENTWTLDTSTYLTSSDLSGYAKLDCTNQPFTGSIAALNIKATGDFARLGLETCIPSSGIKSTYIGGGAGANAGVTDEGNTMLGYRTAYGTSGAKTYNTLVGNAAGYALSTADYNTFVGAYAGRRQVAVSNRLILDAYGDRTTSALELTNALIYGVAAASPVDQTLSLNAITTISKWLILRPLGTDDYCLITSNTENGADNKRVLICGGGGSGRTRGADIVLHGNEHATLPGYIDYSCGGVATAQHRFYVDSGSAVVLALTMLYHVVATVELSSNLILKTGYAIYGSTSTSTVFQMLGVVSDSVEVGNTTYATKIYGSSIAVSGGQLSSESTTDITAGTYTTGSIVSSGGISATKGIQAKQICTGVQTVAVSTTPSVDCSAGDVVVIGSSAVPGALTAATTITFSNPKVGAETELHIKQGTISYAITFTISGYSFYLNGSTASISSGSVVLAAANMVLSQFYTIKIRWLSTTRASVTLLKT